MRIGVDYYPEHWDRELWEADADLMQQTGVEVVRLAEFAWCRLEPQDGVFDLGWLDEFIAILTERGIKTVLCTPTNCPPLWFYEKSPIPYRRKRTDARPVQEYVDTDASMIPIFCAMPSA